MSLFISVESYGHPGSHPASMITEDATHRFVTDAQIAAWDAALAAGITQVLTFGGGAVGEVSTMTITAGIVTAVVLVV